MEAAWDGDITYDTCDLVNIDARVLLGKGGGVDAYYKHFKKKLNGWRK